MLKLLRRSRFWQGIALLGVDTVFFTVTNPAKVTSSVLMLGFLLMSLSVYYLVGQLLTAVRLYGLSFGRHQRRLAVFATAIIAGLLALQSIGELSARDALVLLPLAVVLYVYLGYGRLKTDT